jgi:Zn finger protein HypA/HybF involved in hydrogenase expression
MSEKDESASQSLPTSEEPMLYCPRCNSRLIPRKCKLICELCGYYMGCADYY